MWNCSADRERDCGTERDHNVVVRRRACLSPAARRFCRGQRRGVRNQRHGGVSDRGRSVSSCRRSVGSRGRSVNGRGRGGRIADQDVATAVARELEICSRVIAVCKGDAGDLSSDVFTVSKILSVPPVLSPATPLSS